LKAFNPPMSLIPLHQVQDRFVSAKLYDESLAKGYASQLRSAVHLGILSVNIKAILSLMAWLVRVHPIRLPEVNDIRKQSAPLAT
jgi:hypothetical protein